MLLRISDALEIELAIDITPAAMSRSSSAPAHVAMPWSRSKATATRSSSRLRDCVSLPSRRLSFTSARPSAATSRAGDANGLHKHESDMQNHAHAPRALVDDGGVHEHASESSACVALVAAVGTQAPADSEGLEAEAKLRRAGA